MKAIITFEIDVHPAAYKIHGIKFHSTRPVKIELPKEASDALIKGCVYSVHPMTGEVFHNGEKVDG